MSIKVWILLIITPFIFKYNSLQVDQGINSELKSQNKKKFKIVSIVVKEDLYIVFAERNDSIFKIASLKDNLRECQKIEVSKNYDLELNSYMGNKAQKLDISGIKITDKTLILLEHENNIIHDLFVTDNLVGLCYKPK